MTSLVRSAIECVSVTIVGDKEKAAGFRKQSDCRIFMLPPTYALVFLSQIKEFAHKTTYLFILFSSFRMPSWMG